VEQDDIFLIHTRRIADLAASKKAVNLVAVDVRGLTLIADSFVMCSANSEPQLKAIFNTVHDGMKEAGLRPLRTEGSFQGGWMLIDFGSILFHVFRQTAREFYDLDGLWADAKPIPLELDLDT
jgi:ribosome-associated protein